MSRATSKRAAKARDWVALQQAIEAEQSRIRQPAPAAGFLSEADLNTMAAFDIEPSQAMKVAHPDLPPWPHAHYQYAYLNAMQRALEGRDPMKLLAMLDKRVPLSVELLPVIAEVIRDLREGLSTGKGAKLTARDDLNIRLVYDSFTAPPQSVGVEAARQKLAEEYGVSSDTIGRSLKRTAK